MMPNHDNWAYYFIWCVLIFVVVVIICAAILTTLANIKSVEAGIKESLLEFTCQELATGRVAYHGCKGFKLVFVNGGGILVETDRIRAALVSKGCISKEDSQFILKEEVKRYKIDWL